MSSNPRLRPTRGLRLTRGRRHPSRSQIHDASRGLPSPARRHEPVEEGGACHLGGRNGTWRALTTARDTRYALLGRCSFSSIASWPEAPGASVAPGHRLLDIRILPARGNTVPSTHCPHETPKQYPQDTAMTGATHPATTARPYNFYTPPQPTRPPAHDLFGLALKRVRRLRTREDMGNPTIIRELPASKTVQLTGG